MPSRLNASPQCIVIWGGVVDSSNCCYIIHVIIIAITIVIDIAIITIIITNTAATTPRTTTNIAITIAIATTSCIQWSIHVIIC